MMSKEKQIVEIKECIDAVYGADCAYFDVDGFAIADKIYNAGYRKQKEGEWIAHRHPLLGDYDIRCSCCNHNERRGPAWDISRGVSAFCPGCGARMKGGAEK